MTNKDGDGDAYQIDEAVDRLMRKEAELNPQRKRRGGVTTSLFKNGTKPNYIMIAIAVCVVIFILGAVFGA